MNRRIPRDELMELRREAARRRAKPAMVEAVEEPGPEPVWAVEPQIHSIDLDDGRIDADAAKVVRRLLRAGHEAYLVGGCVRDLMLGRAPKDFDVATSASPDDVRSLFRNSRIIGRRFRLAHVLFGAGKVIETATFRQAPLADEGTADADLLIRDDNAFGAAHEDATRRDFTINGLFYDLEHKRVLDWVGGVPDVERRMVRTIGEPVVRFLEDPVRMLRAIKFTARLDLGMSPRIYDAIVQCRGALAMAARPRLFEELMRLLREGSAHRSMWLAWETGVLDVLLPELSAFLSDDPELSGVVWRLLTALDRRSVECGPLDDTVLAATLLLEPMREVCAGAQDRFAAGTEFLDPIIERLAMPRRIADAVRRVVAMMPRLESGKGARLAKTSIYSLAMEVLELSRTARAGQPAPEPRVPEARSRVAKSGEIKSRTAKSGEGRFGEGRFRESRAAEGRAAEGRAAEGNSRDAELGTPISSESASPSTSPRASVRVAKSKAKARATGAAPKKRSRQRKPELALEG